LPGLALCDGLRPRRGMDRSAGEFFALPAETDGNRAAPRVSGWRIPKGFCRSKLPA
jgi:hypothetical protein